MPAYPSSSTRNSTDIHMKCCRALPTLILCAWCAVAFPGLSYGFQPEQPPTFKASALLGRQLLSGPGYSIDDTVTNDGYMNT